VCVGEIISLLWFSNELKNDLSTNNYLHGIILILLVRESIFVRWGFPFPIVLVPRYKLSLGHTPIKPDLLGFPGIDVFACWLRDHVITRFASSGEISSVVVINDGEAVGFFFFWLEVNVLLVYWPRGMSL
jgi:hypothetical protein